MAVLCLSVLLAPYLCFAGTPATLALSDQDEASCWPGLVALISC